MRPLVRLRRLNRKTVLTRKTNQMCSVHTTLEKFKNATITVNLDLCLRKLGQGNHIMIGRFYARDVNAVSEVKAVPGRL